MRNERIFGLNGLWLKILAMGFMVCDHLWATVVSGQDWLTCLGRLTLPIFAFQIAEGWAHTSDRKKYRRRMFLWALLTEIPFNLMYGSSVIYPFHQNVLFTFWLAMVFLTFIEWAGKKGALARWGAAALSLAVGYYLGFLLFVDYYGYGIITVLLFALTRTLPFGRVIQLLGLAWVNLELMGGLVYPVTVLGHSFEIPRQSFALLALIPIWLYNGQAGSRNKWVRLAGYAFYPVHMLILALVKLY